MGKLLEALKSTPSTEPVDAGSGSTSLLTKLKSEGEIKPLETPLVVKRQSVPQNFDPYAGDRIDKMIDATPDLTDIEKSFVKRAKLVVPPDQLKEDIKVFQGETDKQKESNWFARFGMGVTEGAALGGTGGGLIAGPAGAGVGAAVTAAAFGVGKAAFGNTKNYYIGNDGRPHPLGFGEKAPEGTTIEDAFNSTLVPSDRNALVNAMGRAWNAFSSIEAAPANLLAVGEGLLTGEEGPLSKFAHAVNNDIKSSYLHAPVNPESEKPIFEHIKTIGDIFDKDHIKLTWQNGLGLIGDIGGMIAEFSGIGKLAKIGLPAGTEASYAKTIGATSIAMLGEGLEAAQNAGLDARDAAVVAIAQGLGNAALFHVSGTTTAHLLGHMVEEGTYKEIALAAIKAVKDAGETNTAGKIAQAFKAVMETSAKSGDGWLERYATKAAPLNVATMETVDLYNHGIKQIYNAMNGYSGTGKEGGFEDDLTGEQALSGYAMSALNGLLFAAVGNKKPQDKGKTIYNQLIRGNEPELITALDAMKKGGRITDEDHAAATDMIGKYKGYLKELKGTRLDSETEQEILENSLLHDQIKQNVAVFEAKAKSETGLTPIEEGILANGKKQMKAHISKIAQLMGKALPEGEDIDTGATTANPVILKKAGIKITSKNIDAEPAGTEAKKPVSKKKPEKEIVPDTEYNAFVDKNDVSEERLNSIVDKVISSEKLSQRESAILGGKTTEINKAIKDRRDEELSQAVLDRKDTPDELTAIKEKYDVKIPTDENTSAEEAATQKSKIPEKSKEDIPPAPTPGYDFQSSTDKGATQKRTLKGREIEVYPSVSKEGNTIYKYKYDVKGEQRTGEAAKVYTPQHFEQVYNVDPEHRAELLGNKKDSDVQQWNVYRDSPGKDGGDSTIRAKVIFKDGTESTTNYKLPYSEPVEVEKTPGIKITSKKPEEDAILPAEEKTKPAPKTVNKKAAQKKVFEDILVEKLDTAKKSFNDQIEKIVGKGTARSGGPIELFQATVNAGFEIGKTIIIAEKNIRKAMKVAFDHIVKHGRDVWDALTDDQKSALRAGMEENLRKIHDYLKKASNVEATDDNVSDFAQISGLSEEEAKSAIIKFGERMQFQSNKRRLRTFLTDDENISVVPGQSVSQLQHIIETFARSGAVDEASVKKSYEQLPLDALAKHLQENMDEQDFVWMHNFMTSYKRLKVFHFANYEHGKGKGMTMILSNGEINKKNIASDLYQTFEKTQKEGNLKGEYEKKRAAFIAGSNETFKRIANLFSIDKNGTTLSKILTELQQARVQDNDDLVATLQEKFKKTGQELGLYKLVTDYINQDIKFLSEVTGFSSDQIQPLIDANHKGFDNYTDFLVNSLIQQRQRGGNQSKSLIRHWIVDNALTHEDFVKAITKPKPGNAEWKTQINTLSKLIAESTQQSTLAESFDDVLQNRTDSEEMISTLELMADDIGKQEVQSNPRLKNNPWVKLFQGQQLSTARLDGVKNQKTGKSNNLKNLAPQDLELAMLTAFLDESHEPVNDQKMYYQFYDPQSDAKGKVMIPAMRNDLSFFQGKMTSIATREELNKSVAYWTERTEKLMDAKLITTSKTATELAKEFVYNSAWNKHWQDDYFRGDPSNVKDYQDLVKRKISGSGERLNLKIEGGIGESHNVFIVNDPHLSYEVLKMIGHTDPEAMSDGQELLMPWFDDAIRVSSGGQYGGIVKDIYFKTEDNGKNTMLKGNCVRLDEELAKQYPTLQALLDLAKEKGIDRIAFKSTAKLMDKQHLNDVAWNGIHLTKEALPENPKIYKADNRYMLIQQDLINDAVFKKAALTTQILHIAKSSANGGEIEKHLAMATEEAYNELRDEIKALDVPALKQWFLDNIPNEPSYLGVRQVLASEHSTLDDPAYRSFLNSIFGSIVEKRMLGIPSNKIIGIHVQIPGIDLQSMRLEKGKVRFGEMMVPANSMRSKQVPSGVDIEEVVIPIRVPSDDWHSFSPQVVKGAFPENMGNVIMIDGEAQKSAGMDNDADAGHVWAKFKNSKGEVIKYDPEGSNTYKGMMNRVHQLIVDEFKDPANFDMVRRPIDTKAVDPLIENYKKKGNVNKNLPESAVSAFDANRQSQIVTGRTANAIKVKNYLVAVKAVLKDAIQFPQYTKEGKATGNKSELKDFSHEREKQEKINGHMGNNLNQSLDNPKLNKLFYMGKVAAVTDIFDFVSMMDPDIQQSLVHFMNNSTVQDYIRMYDEQKSVLGEDQANVFEMLAKKYNNGQALKNEFMFKRPWENQKWNQATQQFERSPDPIPVPSAQALNNKTPNFSERLEVLKYLSHLEYLSRDIGEINAAIRLNDNSAKSYAQYIKSFRSLQNIAQGKLKSIDKKSSVALYDSFALNRAKSNVEILREFYSRDIFTGGAGRTLIHSIEDAFGINKRGLDKKGEVKKYNINEDQIDLLYRSFYDFAAVQALNITESRKDLQAKAKAAFESLPADNTLRKYLQVNSAGELVLNPNLQRKDTDVAQTKEAQKASKAFTAEQKMDMLKYVVRQFGYNVSQKSGNFLRYLDVESQQAVMSRKVNELDMEHPDLVKSMVEQVMKNNLDLIPEAVLLANSISKETAGKLWLGDDSRNPMTLKKQTDKYPPFVRKFDAATKKWMLYPVQHSDKIGNHYTQDTAFEYEKNDNAQYTPVDISDKTGKLDYQAKLDWEERASTDPVLAEKIQQHLKKTFPWIERFSNPNSFQEYLDTHHPGEILDVEAIGAEVDNAYYINEGEAFQSTELHEVFHKYFDMIPEQDPTKQALVKMFGNEQAIIDAVTVSHGFTGNRAIDEAIVSRVGREAFKQAELEFEGTKWERFKQLLSQLWIKIKRAIWPKSVTMEEQVKIMADRFWKNSDQVDEYTTRSELVDYMKKMKPYAVKEKEIDRIKEEIGRDDLKDITVRDVAQLSDKINVPFDKDKPYFYSLAEVRYGPFPIDMEALAQKENRLVRIATDTFAEKKFGHTRTWYESHGDKDTVKKNLEKIDNAYSAYTVEMARMDEIIEEHKLEDTLFEMNKSDLDKLHRELKAMSNLTDLGDNIHNTVLNRVLEINAYNIVAREISKNEALPGFSGNKIFIKMLHEIAFGEDQPDWSSFMKDMFGKGMVANWTSLRDVREKPLQALYEMRGDGLSKTNKALDTVFATLNHVNSLIKKSGASVKDVIYKKGNRQFFISQDGEKYKELSAKSDPASKALKQYLDLHYDYMRTYADMLPNDENFYAVPQAKMDWYELLKSYGFKSSPLKALGNAVRVKLTDGEQYDFIHVNMKDAAGKYMTLNSAKKKIMASSKAGLFSQLSAGIKINKLINEARDMYNSSAKVDRGQQIIVRKNDEQFHDAANFRVTANTTENTHAALLQYYHQQVFQHVFSPKVPMMEYLEKYYDKGNTENIATYVKMMNDWFLYGKEPESRLGKAEKFLKFFNHLALLQFLGFNLKAGGFNAGAGITQNIREMGVSASLKGVKRTFEGLRPNADWKNAFTEGKMFHMLSKYKIVNVSRDLEISPGSVLNENINHLLYSPIAVTEMFNHGVTVGGLIPDEIWNNYDNKFELKKDADPTLILTDDMVNRLINEASRIHGAYDKNGKRPINATTAGRSLMLLKNWLPDAFLAHWSTEFEDSTDTTRKGIINSWIDSYKEVFLKKGSIRDNFHNLSDIDKENLGKGMREMMMTALLMIAASSLTDDKNAKGVFIKMASEISTVYDMNTYEFLLSGPVPAFKAVINSIHVAKQLIYPTFYAHKTEFGEAGDWKGRMAIVNNLPANRLIKEFYLKRDK